MIDSAQVARHLAHARAGSSLVSYRAVALPLFRIECDLLVLDSKEVPPIQEFVLRAVELGLTELPDVAGLLGIDESVVRGAAAELLRSDAMILSPSPSSGRHALRLTSKGKQAAQDAQQTQAVEVTLPIWIDGLTREVLSVSGRALSPFPASQAAGRGLAEISAFPRKRPGIEAVPFESVRSVFDRETSGRRGKRELVGITGLGKARRFAREAVALAYHAPGESDPVIHLAVDGEISERHDNAWAAARQRSSRRLAPETWVPVERALATELDADVLAQAANTDDLEQEQSLASEELESLTAQVSTTQSSDVEELQRRLAAAEEREREMRAALASISVRQVQVYEHRGYLDRALAEARQRVMLISPWVRDEVLDDELTVRLRKVVERGVELWIGYGINNDGQSRRKKDVIDSEALRRLQTLERDFPGQVRLKRLGDTHAKVLICDSKFSILTSFNWLSFLGDPELEFRDERGYYVAISDKVDELFATYRARFE